ncbi:hypothetical protein F5Y15DRAFT_384015 [Xylariaceae sp. FL0016]|nr:hypothetical protein F5Y15DRAFT_384015 [Xylariaceae sp. FL0016]
MVYIFTLLSSTLSSSLASAPLSTEVSYRQVGESSSSRPVDGHNVFPSAATASPKTRGCNNPESWASPIGKAHRHVHKSPSIPRHMVLCQAARIPQATFHRIPLRASTAAAEADI